MDYVVSFLKWSNDHGIWDAAQFLVVAFGLGIGVKLIFFPRRRIRNLNFFTQLERESHPQLPLLIRLELRNYTGTTVVLSSPFLSIATCVLRLKHTVTFHQVNTRSSFLIRPDNG